MDAPDPEGISLLAKVVAAGIAIIGPIWGARTWLDKRFDKKADKHSVSGQFQVVTNELGTQRTHIAKIFDQMTASERIAEARHRELMMHLLDQKK